MHTEAFALTKLPFMTGSAERSAQRSTACVHNRLTLALTEAAVVAVGLFAAKKQAWHLMSVPDGA